MDGLDSQRVRELGLHILNWPGGAPERTELVEHMPRQLTLWSDLDFSYRDQYLIVGEQTDGAVRQVVLVGFDPPADRTNHKTVRRGQSRRRVAVCDDDLVTTYLRRLAAYGAAAKGINAYRYQPRTTVQAAHRLSGCSVTMVELFGNSFLLGRALVDEGSTTALRLSKWTLAQRRSAIRSFAAVMRPELLGLVGEEPRPVIDRALRAVAERVGSGYRLPGGRPRQRGEFVPTPEEVEKVLTMLETRAELRRAAQPCLLQHAHGYRLPRQHAPAP